MSNVFVTDIRINKVRHLKNIHIALSNTERQHLIFTGKNGSGKTSVLESMRRLLSFPRSKLDGLLKRKQEEIDINFSIKSNTCEYMHIDARRIGFAADSDIFANKNTFERRVMKRGGNFLSYLVELDYHLYGAKSDNNQPLVENIEKWFSNFLAALQIIYDCPELKLKRDTKNLTFRIEMPDREPFALNEMSGGYEAFIQILAELLMRMETEDMTVDYNKSVIVLIDEVETHMHVELQKRALPFLVQMFPNAQFIVATHSPFVITSLENAVVFDLEKNERLENPSFYAYDTVVESFLNASMYSNELVKYFNRYKELCFKERTPAENEEFLRAKSMLEIYAPRSEELYIAFQNLEAQRKAGKHGKTA